MSKTININKLAHPDTDPHTNFGAMTRIWTLRVKRSQLKSDKVTKNWTLNVKRSQLKSDKVTQNWTLNVKRSQLRSDKVTQI